MTRHALIAGLLTLCFLAAAAATSNELESLVKQAGQNFQTKEGRHYLEEFQKGIMPTFGRALDTCSTSMPDTKEPASIVLVVAADGTVKRLLYSTDIPLWSMCWIKDSRHQDSSEATARQLGCGAWGCESS